MNKVPGGNSPDTLLRPLFSAPQPRGQRVEGRAPNQPNSRTKPFAPHQAAIKRPGTTWPSPSPSTRGANLPSAHVPSTVQFPPCQHPQGASTTSATLTVLGCVLQYDWSDILLRISMPRLVSDIRRLSLQFHLFADYLFGTFCPAKQAMAEVVSVYQQHESSRSTTVPPQ